MFWFLTKYMRQSELVAATMDLLMLSYRYNLDHNDTAEYRYLLGRLAQLKRDVNNNFDKWFYAYDMHAHDMLVSRIGSWCASVMAHNA